MITPELPDIILASASPRRKELLNQVGIKAEIFIPDINESPKPNEAPLQYVNRMAREKAEFSIGALGDLLQQPDKLLIAADTCVVSDDQIMGKPENEAAARAMLQTLSAQTHQVMTAICVNYASQWAEDNSISMVTFKSLTAPEIDAYIATGEPLDKAGSYAIQGKGAAFIKGLSGSYSGVMGLPLYETLETIRRIIRQHI